MHRNTLETVMGAIVLLAAAGFVALAYEAADVKGKGGYEISAEFGSTGGLLVGDDVLQSSSIIITIKSGAIYTKSNCRSYIFSRLRCS